jgi:hypothetical protein
MRVQAPLYGIGNRRYRKENINNRRNENLKPRLERNVAQTAAAGAAEVAQDTPVNKALEDPRDATVPWSKEEDRLLISLLRDHLVEDVAEYMNAQAPFHRINNAY